MTVAEVLARGGGVATHAALAAATTRIELEAAVRSGEVVVLARGRYALPDAEKAVAVAHQLFATVSHRHAALRWGWGVKTVPDLPEVTVPRNRRLTSEQQAKAIVHRAALSSADVVGAFTSKNRTLVDCLRNLPPDEALAIADSALRAGETSAWLADLAKTARGPGSQQVRATVGLARIGAAGPFESVTRHIADGVPGLNVEPQVAIYDPGFLGRPDLVDEKLRIVLEADSFEWHGGRADLDKDARRYNALVVRGWLVLRFSYEEVMFHPDRVHATLVAAVHRRTQAGCCCSLPA